MGKFLSLADIRKSTVNKKKGMGTTPPISPPSTSFPKGEGDKMNSMFQTANVHE
jgi:hypothetical protein